MYTLTNLLNDIPVAGVLLAIIFIYAAAILYMVIDVVLINNALINEFEDVEPEPKSTVSRI